MFQDVAVAPPDAIFGLAEAYQRDPDPGKINLTVGVYQDDAGRTPTLAAVCAAERRLLAAGGSKTYLPIRGTAAYAAAIERLLLGAGHPALTEGRVATVHTPGGTAALRIAADYLQTTHPGITVWLTDPTWANHRPVFAAAGLPVRELPYLDRAEHRLALDGLLAALAVLPAGDVVVLHGCCHNPTGVDPSPAEWAQLAAVLAERRALPLLDVAYLGFADGIEEDAAALRLLAETVPELLICNSFSKSMGLYNERVGSLTVVAGGRAAAEAVLSRVLRAVRASYSNPPAHGGGIATLLLDDDELRADWLTELAAMRARLRRMRRRLAGGLEARGVRLSAGGNEFLARQRGMFSFSGLAAAQVAALRRDHSIYLLESGRISVAGVNPGNLERLCDAIAAVAPRSSP